MSPLEGLSFLVGACWSELAASACVSAVRRLFNTTGVCRHGSPDVKPCTRIQSNFFFFFPSFPHADKELHIDEFSAPSEGLTKKKKKREKGKKGRQSDRCDLCRTDSKHARRGVGAPLRTHQVLRGDAKVANKVFERNCCLYFSRIQAVMQRSPEASHYVTDTVNMSMQSECSRESGSSIVITCCISHDRDDYGWWYLKDRYLYIIIPAAAAPVVH